MNIDCSCISVTTLQPLHACFSLENGELVEVCLVIYGFQMAGQLLRSLCIS